MGNGEAKENGTKKLVDVTPGASLSDIPVANTSTNKRIRRLADPHLRAHKVKGRLYYYYVRGTDKEIYLGDADTILEAVLRLKNGR